MTVILSVSSISERLVHLLNVSGLMVVTPHGIAIFFFFFHESKADVFIDVTLSGIEISERFLQ